MAEVDPRAAKHILEREDPPVADSIAIELLDAQMTWLRTRDDGVLRRALLAVLMRLG